MHRPIAKHQFVLEKTFTTFLVNMKNHITMKTKALQIHARPNIRKMGLIDAYLKKQFYGMTPIITIVFLSHLITGHVMCIPPSGVA